MDDKEKEVQDALGLLKIYEGYVEVSTREYSHYDVYEVQDVTLKGAETQLDKIVKAAQKKSKKSRTSFRLAFITDKAEKPYDTYFPRSNSKN